MSSLEINFMPKQCIRTNIHNSYAETFEVLRNQNKYSNTQTNRCTSTKNQCMDNKVNI